MLPRVDAHFSGPLRRLAVKAAPRVPPGEAIVLLGLRHRPSVCFYGDRPTTYVSAGGGRKAREQLFGSSEARIGITSEPLLTRFPARDRLEILERDLGYVVFRAPPGPTSR